jgi:hypothetical protein
MPVQFQSVPMTPNPTYSVKEERPQSRVATNNNYVPCDNGTSIINIVPVSVAEQLQFHQLDIRPATAAVAREEGRCGSDTIIFGVSTACTLIPAAVGGIFMPPGFVAGHLLNFGVAGVSLNGARSAICPLGRQCIRESDPHLAPNICHPYNCINNIVREGVLFAPVYGVQLVIHAVDPVRR